MTRGVTDLFEDITKEFIRTHKFLADMPPVDRPAQSFRLSGRNLPPSPAELQGELRKSFAAIMATTFNGDYVTLENSCYINADTMRKYLNGRRPITLFAVAKICVGAKLSVERTCELFRLCEHVLSPELYLFDAIVVDTLKCGETIEDFYATTKEFGFEKFWSKWDKSLA